MSRSRIDLNEDRFAILLDMVWLFIMCYSAALGWGRTSGTCVGQDSCFFEDIGCFPQAGLDHFKLSVDPVSDGLFKIGG